MSTHYYSLKSETVNHLTNPTLFNFTVKEKCVTCKL